MSFKIHFYLKFEYQVHQYSQKYFLECFLKFYHFQFVIFINIPLYYLFRISWRINVINLASKISKQHQFTHYGLIIAQDSKVLFHFLFQIGLQFNLHFFEILTCLRNQNVFWISFLSSIRLLIQKTLLIFSFSLYKFYRSF